MNKILEKSPVKWHHLLIYGIVCFLAPRQGFWFDLNNDWPRWSAYAWENGLSNVYNSDTNYMPFYLHLLYWFGKFQGSRELIYQNSYQLKYCFLVFDFLQAILLTHSLKKYLNKNNYVEYLLLFNIAYLYSSAFWGQLDCIPSFFVVLSFIYLFEKRLVWAALCMVLALYVKLQAIIFVPIFVPIFAYYFYLEYSFKLLIKTLLAVFSIQLFLLAPFIWSGSLDKLWSVVTHSVGFFPRVTWNAFNMWHLLLKSNPNEVSDTLIFKGLSYKLWGLLMFFSGSFVGMFPLLRKLVLNFFDKTYFDKKTIALVWLTSATVAVLFFYVNTQMHERYSYPAMILYFGYGFLSNRYLLYFLSSFAYFLNVDAILQAFKINPFKPEYNALLWGIILLISFYRLYEPLILNKETNEKDERR